MLDGKILAAVLASLAAFGIASGGQTMDGNMESMDIPSMDDLNPRSIGAFTGLIPKDTSTSEVTATLTYNKSRSQEAKFKSGTLNVSNMTSVSTGSQDIQSSNAISLHNFQGTVQASEKSLITGKTSSIYSNGVNISGDYNVEREITTSQIRAEGAVAPKLKFNDVNGEVVSGSTSAELTDSDTDVSIRSFEGDMRFNPLEGKIYLDGEVTSLKAGDVSIS